MSTNGCFSQFGPAVFYLLTVAVCADLFQRKL